jgi:hypothetical protein
MLNYAYIEEEEPLPLPPKQLNNKPSMIPKMPVSQDETECNLVVMFFVIGVIMLAVMDSIKK